MTEQRHVKIVKYWDQSRTLFDCDIPDEIAVGMEMRYALRCAVLSGAVLRCADLSGADLSDADLRGADLSDADLRGADLRGADLSDADLSCADLRGADLRGADLSDADLSCADLSGADLSDADLRGADLRGADLSDADLRGADLRGADLSDADLSCADLRGADLRGADLSDADLSCADLSGAVLSCADLSGAVLSVQAATTEESIANLDKVGAIILDNSQRLEMGHWHDDEEWKNRTCAEEAACETTHCLAGWLQVCSTNPDIREFDPQTAGTLCAPIASKMFFRNSDVVLDWLKNRKYVSELEEKEIRKAARAAKKAE